MPTAIWAYWNRAMAHAGTDDHAGTVDNNRAATMEAMHPEITAAAQKIGER
jgi:hypothetical protein